jgi:hypothetical protein
MNTRVRDPTDSAGIDSETSHFMFGTPRDIPA